MSYADKALQHAEEMAEAEEAKAEFEHAGGKSLAQVKAEMMTDAPTYIVCADAFAHLQRLEDLPEVGSQVEVCLFGQIVGIKGEVFAHVPAPENGWGFALIRYERNADVRVLLSWRRP